MALTLSNVQSISGSDTTSHVLATFKIASRKSYLVGFDKCKENPNLMYTLGSVRYSIFNMDALTEAYQSGLKNILTQQEWKTIINEIEETLDQQNSKLVKLFDLVAFNGYRSFTGRLFSWVTLASKSFKTSLACFLIFPFCICIYLCILIDAITYPRFFFCLENHKAFISSIITAHPEFGDPLKYEDELISNLVALTEKISKRHGITCVEKSCVEHIHAAGSDASYNMECIEILILNSSESV